MKSIEKFLLFFPTLQELNFLFGRSPNNLRERLVLHAIAAHESGAFHKQRDDILVHKPHVLKKKRREWRSSKIGSFERE